MVPWCASRGSCTPGYKRFFTQIDPAMNTMAALLRLEHAPATIMSMPRSPWLPPRGKAPSGTPGR